MKTLLNRFNLMILICQTIGLTNINNIPTIAMAHGAAGCILAFFAVYIFLGIPLLYMELIIGQFTGRDCVDVWSIRPCLSYTGYVLILWQVTMLVYNHVFVSFTVHYFLISFENPIPYYKCGWWSTRDCNIVNYNYTVNENCLRKRQPEKHCDDLHTTFPEYQYWRNNLLELRDHKTFSLYSLHIAGRVCLASGLVCLVLYLSSFKRKDSFKWIVSYLPICSILGFVPIMMGSMLQKGLIASFEDALDLDFSTFTKKFRLANIIQQVVYNLGIGTGISFNFASTSSFRSNCFSNGVIAVVISAVFSVLVICTNVMMMCPYTFSHNISPEMFVKMQLSLVFEKIPHLLYRYENRLLWILLVYSCYSILGLCSHVLLFYNLLEIVTLRNPKISNYPGLICIVGVTLLFLVTIPLFSNIGIIFALAFRRYVTLVSTFVAMIECIVFVVCYGIHKFSEDVHFMLGIQPSFYMKTAWLLAVGFLGYTLCSEIIYYYKTYSKHSVIVDVFGAYVLLSICAIFVICCIGKLFVAFCRKKFLKMFRLDLSWGPRSQILQRSRGMFSAQAMTKEYIYRQYHLQAGIISRQRNANKRKPNEIEEQTFSL